MIADILRWGKSLIPHTIIPAIIVLVGLAAFGLGRLSGLKAGEKGLIITTTPPIEEEAPDYAP